MSRETVIERVKKWRELAASIDDDYIKFITEYIAFNALARQKYGYEIPDTKLVTEEIGPSVPYAIFKKEDIEDLENLMPLKNVRNVKTNRRDRIITKEELEEAKNIVKAIYWIRNNLLHGDKEYYLTSEEVYSRDAALVKVGYRLLLSLNDWLLEKV